ncbi:MAG TPA: CpsB/CapC family capsule biosynthesis tyrosine phosphatase [Gaiellaceae bacterium]|nr:CpsB/CapC family capsule biosynthesis tyrosine phosphatase [Gaiellaceae bacterium]
MEPLFVDCHSHVVPSGDDGAKTPADGLELCDLAADSGTAILFATPHVWPHLPLTDERERQIQRAYDRLKARARLELRLGFELTPAPPLLDEDPARYVLEGTQVVLVEMPFPGHAADLVGLAEHVERAGLTPLVAHPERTEPVLERPELAHELALRWPLQVNSTSLLGRHGTEIGALAWRLVEAGDAAVVASDGHRLTRPARVDEAYELVRARVGEEAALPLFNGSALGLSSGRPTPSRAAAPGA